MNKQNLIHTYNQPGNLLVVTNYPPRGAGVHAAKIGGVSGFAKNTLIPLSKQYAQDGKKIIVLADILDTPSMYEENGMLIVRAWKRDNIKLYIELLHWIKKLSHVKNILIEFEFATFGDFATTGWFPIFLGLLRLVGRRTTVVLHQVVTDLWSIIGHIGLRFDSREFKMFSFLLPLYYFLITHMAHRTVVLEDVLKKRLAKIGSSRTIAVVPHGIQEIQKTRVKKANNEFVVTAFGFITWYKGTDILLRLLQKPLRIAGKKLRLVIAGGPSTSQQHKAHYQAYYQSILDMAKGKSHITVTGFVPDEKIAQYLAASDVVVFPYRAMMSSSGPLSLALAMKKPILVSGAMSELFQSADMQESFKTAHMNLKDILIPETTQTLVRKVESMQKSGFKKRMRVFHASIRGKRSFTNLAQTYYTILNEAKTSVPGWTSLSRLSDYLPKLSTRNVAHRVG